MKSLREPGVSFVDKLQGISRDEKMEDNPVADLSYLMIAFLTVMIMNQSAKLLRILRGIFQPFPSLEK